jgi:hypothetical protein
MGGDVRLIPLGVGEALTALRCITCLGPGWLSFETPPLRIRHPISLLKSPLQRRTSSDLVLRHTQYYHR